MEKNFQKNNQNQNQVNFQDDYDGFVDITDFNNTSNNKDNNNYVADDFINSDQDDDIGNGEDGVNTMAVLGSNTTNGGNIPHVIKNTINLNRPKTSEGGRRRKYDN